MVIAVVIAMMVMMTMVMAITVTITLIHDGDDWAYRCQWAPKMDHE